jgi:hypothetical protein
MARELSHRYKTNIAVEHSKKSHECIWYNRWRVLWGISHGLLQGLSTWPICYSQRVTVHWIVYSSKFWSCCAVSYWMQIVRDRDCDRDHELAGHGHGDDLQLKIVVMMRCLLLTANSPWPWPWPWISWSRSWRWLTAEDCGFWLFIKT